MIWFDQPLVGHELELLNDLEHVPMMDFAGLFHALCRWMWP
jgi:hypothetical protein